MTVHYIYVIFGCTVDQEEYLKARGYTQKDIEEKSTIEMIQGDTYAYLNSEKVEGEELVAQVQTHDVDESEPIVVGLLLSTIGVSYGTRKEKGVRDIDLSTDYASWFKNSLAEELAESNPTLYALLQGKKASLHFVANDCACCN